VQAACPGIRLMLISPFVLEGWATKATEEQPDRWERFKTDVAAKAEAVRHVAEKYHLPLIELQPIFDAVCEVAPAAHWSADGVHPTPAGHELIKRAWLEAFEYLE
jgi:lysophospholipase L1-like esterase